MSQELHVRHADVGFPNVLLEQRDDSTVVLTNTFIAPFKHQCQLARLLPTDHADGHGRIEEVQLTVTGYRANMFAPMLDTNA